MVSTGSLRFSRNESVWLVYCTNSFVMCVGGCVVILPHIHPWYAYAWCGSLESTLLFVVRDPERISSVSNVLTNQQTCSVQISSSKISKREAHPMSISLLQRSPREMEESCSSIQTSRNSLKQAEIDRGTASFKRQKLTEQWPLHRYVWDYGRVEANKGNSVQDELNRTFWRIRQCDSKHRQLRVKKT